jgi:MFS family permease
MFRPIRAVIPLLVSTMLMVAGIALGNLLTPLRADLEGWPATTIGLIGTSYAFAFTLGCIMVPVFVKRIGHLKAYGLAMALLALSVILLSTFIHPLSWGFFRAMTGFAGASAYVITEAWLNERSENETRGVVFSWYMLACLTGTICGQYALPLSTPAEGTLFFMAALCFLSATLPVILSRIAPPTSVTTVRIDLRGVIRNSPAAAVGGLLSGILFGTWTAFGALYASTRGFDGTAIATVLMAATLGGLVLQFPVGYLSDRMDRRLVMAIVGALGLATAVVSGLTLPSGLGTLWIAFFLLGATLHTTYSLNVAHASDHAKPGGFVGISSAMMVTFGIGTTTGPFVAGFVIDAFGYRGFFSWMAAAYLVYVVFPLWRMQVRGAPDERLPFSRAKAGEGGTHRP